MLALIPPTAALEAEWREAHEEWGSGAHEDGFGLQPSDKVDTSAGFAAWVERLDGQTRQGRAPETGCSYRWIVDGETVLGGIALRHNLDAALLHAGGHVGFGLRPSARGRRLGVWALMQMLGEAREIGLPRVLLVCALDNLASAKAIERCGGVLEDVRDTTLGPVRRYWIDFDRHLSGPL